MEERQLLQDDVRQPNHHLQPPPSASSSSSSPSHEFSFTISLHNTHSSKSSPPPSNPLNTLDLSPADDIFFHGHLLPLHLLSHLPRAQDQTHRLDTNNTRTIDQNMSRSSSHDDLDTEGARKSKSFSPFKIPSKIWRKDQSKLNPQNDDVLSYHDQHRRPRMSKFEAMKRFLKSIKLKPGFLSLLRRSRNPDELLREQQQQYSSYSGNLRMRTKKETKGCRRRGDQFSSAPVTTRNSPTNSGVLVASGTVTPTAKNDSTMEELQAAIQAAIAHCKKSIAAEDKIQLP